MRQRPRTVLLAIVIVLVALSSVAPVLAQERAAPGVNPADMDLAVDPGADFYRFANGGWLDRTELPADEASYGTYPNELQDRNTALLVGLLTELGAAGTVRPDSDEWKAVRYFQQGTDLAARDAAGIEPIRPQLDEIDAIPDLAGFHQYLQGATFDGIVGGLLPIQVSADQQDSQVNTLYLGGPSLGLPVRDYYLEDDEANEPIRAAYRQTSAELLSYLGDDPERARAAADAVDDLERRLAEPTLTREQRQDRSLTYNPTAVADLPARYPLMDWPGYLQTLGLRGMETVIVTEPGYLDALPAIVAATPVETLKDYLRLRLLWNLSESLTSAIEETAFDFHGRVLGGVEEMRPIEERTLDQVNGLMGEAVGKLYVAEAFPPEAKAQVEELVADVKVAFQRRLEANSWMSPETKAKALEKLAALDVKVGYPDVWRSYEAVEVGDSYGETTLNALNAELRRNLAQAGRRVDPDEWFTPPQTVSAYYTAVFNEILLPAGILQPPFFDHQADPAANYGAVGLVIGHEITHGFDLQGSQFDAQGNLASWWTPQDNDRFQALNDRVVAQYGAIEALPGVFLNGQITVTENVADMGGVQVAYDALQRRLASDGAPLPPPPSTEASAGPNLTPEQRFFVAVATVWRQETREEALRTQVQAGIHAPARVRATQPIRNMDAFHEAFGIGPDDPMYLPPEERIVVW